MMIAMSRRVLTLLGLVLVVMFLCFIIGGSCATLTTQGPFLVKNLTIEPVAVQPNEVVTITVSVTNTHDTWGIYNLFLKINGVKEAEKQANVDAGGSQDVNFIVTRENPGSYAVFINGLSGSFTVVTPAPP